jgi:hypothetical protein
LTPTITNTPTITPCPDTDDDGLTDCQEAGLGTNPLIADTDSDGCTDGAELGPDQVQGGLRDPLNFWDFYDTPDINNFRDKAVTIGDITRVVQRFGAQGDPGGDPFSLAPPPPAYHTAFDRSYAGPREWNLGAPNGSVTIEDILRAIAQFSHSCI